MLAASDWDGQLFRSVSYLLTTCNGNALVHNLSLDVSYFMTAVMRPIGLPTSGFLEYYILQEYAPTHAPAYLEMSKTSPAGLGRWGWSP
jgi:hypothetical protein